MRPIKKLISLVITTILVLHIPSSSLLLANPQNGFQMGFSTFFGGSDWDRVQNICVDANGFIYIAGTTDSNDLPTTPGAFQTSGSGGQFDNDGYVAKFSPDGHDLIWATYLQGSGRDDIYGIRLDSAGNVVVAGWTLSTDFPITHGIGVYDETHNGNFDIFVTKIKPDGTGLIFSTYVGGSGKDQTRGAMAIDASGGIVFSGYTDSTNFPVTANAYQTTYQGGYGDAIIFKLSGDGKTLLASTYLGSSGADAAFSGIGVHSDGSVIVTGWAGAADFPVSPGAFQTNFGGAGTGTPWSGDSFVARFSPNLSNRIYATFLGGSLDDAVATQNGLVLDSTGNAIVSGRTDSTNFPVTGGAYQTNLKGHADFFVSKISLDGSQLLASTYFGGAGDNGFYYEASGIQVDSNGNIYFSGQTSDPTLPVTPNALQPIIGGMDDAVLVVLPPSMNTPIYSSYFGGSDHDRSRTLSLDPNDESVVFGGDTYSPDLLTTSGVYHPNPTPPINLGEAYLVKFSPIVNPSNQPPTIAQVASANPNPVLGTTTNLSVMGADDGGETALKYTWSTTGTPPAPVTFNINGTNAAKNSVATFAKSGAYQLQVRIQDVQGLFVTSPVTVNVNQTLTSIIVSPQNTSVMVNGTKQFSAIANDQFSFAMNTQPTFQWVVNGGGSINSSGLFTAGLTPGGPFTVIAQSGNMQGAAQISVMASQPPVVNLTSPADGMHFTAPATVNIGATATDPDGTVSKVEFFSGNTKLGQDTSAPYAFQWANVPVGFYVLTAKATDNANGTSTSLPVSITVDPVAPTNQAPSVDAGIDQNISMAPGALLSGVVSDDGLPNPPGTTTTLWSKDSGPGVVTFLDTSVLSTTADFSSPGTYVLRLTANDGALSSFDTVQIIVDGNPAQNGGNSGETRFTTCMDLEKDRLSPRICYELAHSGPVKLSVFSSKGNKIRLLKNADVPAGSDIVIWDRRDDEGSLVSSGIYRLVLEADGRTLIRNLAVIK